MKFQKLSENKLKIILSNDELPNTNNLDDFIANSTEARHAILNILDKAYDEVGFNAKDYKIKIDAVALYNGTFVFTITKLIKVKKVKKSAKPKKIIKSEQDNFLIYQFEKFDDYYNFCSFIKKINIPEKISLAKKTELYLYNNKYYLLLFKPNRQDELSTFYSYITEFSRFFSNKELFVSVLQEKGSLIIKDNAIKIKTA